MYSRIATLLLGIAIVWALIAFDILPMMKDEDIVDNDIVEPLPTSTIDCCGRWEPDDRPRYEEYRGPYHNDIVDNERRREREYDDRMRQEFDRWERDQRQTEILEDMEDRRQEREDERREEMEEWRR